MVLYFLKTDYEENVYIKTKHLLLKGYCHDYFLILLFCFYCLQYLIKVFMFPCLYNCAKETDLVIC